MTVDPHLLTYQAGFGNEFASEALPGALSEGQNSPQRPPYGLYPELISGTTFAAPRALNQRTWAYRTHPSVVHSEFRQLAPANFLTPPLPLPPNPNQMRWDPFKLPDHRQDFLEGMTTVCGNGSPLSQTGMSMHIYLATSSMANRYFADSDGELLIIPDHGSLLISTEMGQMKIAPGELALIPRAIKFKVNLLDGVGRGFVCENYGVPFRLPELGLIGSNGLANAIDFQAPVAHYESDETPSTLVQKFGGTLWEADLPHSPLNVVAWRGTLTPFKFDMYRFVAMGTVTVDHPDPSIFCALTSEGHPVLGGNADFMIMPPRWLVAEHTFRPPSFHRNCVSEYLGIIAGKHEAKAHGFQPGGASLHNNWAAHGPDTATVELARSAVLAPVKIEDSLIFMFESRLPLQLSKFAAQAPELQGDYRDCWQDLPRLQV